MPDRFLSALGGGALGVAAMGGRSTMRHSVIIGKFLPFHRGHAHLIERGQALCDRLTVIVFSTPWEPIPGSARAASVAELFPDVRVVHEVADHPDPYDDRTWDYWVWALRRVAPDADTLITSEGYGDEYARRLGMGHVCVDQGRQAVPISGTLIREDPIRHWDQLTPGMRPFFVRRVVAVGAESTGKTTLCQRLADDFGTEWVPEYGREFLEAKGEGTGKALCEYWDLLTIAQEQARREDAAARRANRVLLCDTDLMVTDAFGAFYFGGGPPEVREMADQRARLYSLHLLLSTQNTWIDDGTRDCAESDREWFQGRYRSELRWRRQRFVELPGGEAGYTEAKRALEDLVSSSTIQRQ
ncbi:hypothetical protein EON81_07645 [bacterium]|nr:MAG: hypothetical protein EON81_07645 [bacterium]